MENEKVEALMQEMDIQRKALARAREMVEAIYQEKQEKPAETEEDWIRANLKEGDLVEVRDSYTTIWGIVAYLGFSEDGRVRARAGIPFGEMRWRHVRLPRRWLPHLGGECPVPEWMKKVDLAFADGDTREDARTEPLIWRWDRLDLDTRIIAYRIPEEQ